MDRSNGDIANVAKGLNRSYGDNINHVGSTNIAKHEDMRNPLEAATSDQECLGARWLEMSH